MKAAIIQPTYFPWLGYFALMDQVDIFVFLDSVQFDRRSWQQRNRIKTPHGAHYLTIPVLKKGKFDQKVNEVKIDHSANPMQDHIKTIRWAYGKAQYFDAYAPAIFALLEKSHDYLSQLTMELILLIKDKMGIKCQILQSSLLPVDGRKAELMADICSYLSATTYVSPVGSKDYLDQSSVFQERGIKLAFNEYQHPVYRQLHEPFLEYLGIIDLLFNEGPQSLSIIRKGIKTVYAGA